MGSTVRLRKQCAGLELTVEEKWIGDVEGGGCWLDRFRFEITVPKVGESSIALPVFGSTIIIYGTGGGEGRQAVNSQRGP
eukprot:scaffold74842_cov42-Cyclotella_meneghiniana.AAC.2